MLAAERRQQIARFVREHGAVQVIELCARFKASASTIRRDLQTLEEQGLLRRAYGGAVATDRGARPADPSLTVDRLAAGAVGCLSDGETIFVGAGPCALALARHLAARSSITAITNALDTAAYLARHGMGTVVLTGGQVERPGSALVGHIAELALHELRADTALISAAGLHVPNGVTGDSLHQAGLVRLMIDMVSRVIVIAESRCWGQVGPAYLAPLQGVDVIVTDRDAPPAMVWDVTELGIQVIQL